MSISADNEHEQLDEQQICSLVDEITQSLASARGTIKSLREKAATDLDTSDGISLLSLKHHLLLSYLQSLVLLTSRRALGHSLSERSPPKLPFSSSEREARGGGVGDLVDSMIEGRVVLEKIKVLESRMRYQIEKLVRVAEEAPSANQNTIDDPLAFRPNPQNLMNNGEISGDDKDDNDDGADSTDKRDGIYRPPKLAPMPYTEANSKKARRPHVPSTLSSLLHNDPSLPHAESTSGLAIMPSLASNRAREVERYNEFEEENFTRLVMKKKDAKRRKKDEEDIALGGSGGIVGRRRGGGLEDEFGDVLRSVGRGGGALGDGYEELRKKGKKKDVLVRSRTRGRDEAIEGGEEGRARKKGRFEKEVKAVKKRLNKSRS